MSYKEEYWFMKSSEPHPARENFFVELVNTTNHLFDEKNNVFLYLDLSNTPQEKHPIARIMLEVYKSSSVNYEYNLKFDIKHDVQERVTPIFNFNPNLQQRIVLDKNPRHSLISAEQEYDVVQQIGGYRHQVPTELVTTVNLQFLTALLMLAPPYASLFCLKSHANISELSADLTRKAMKLLVFNNFNEDFQFTLMIQEAPHLGGYFINGHIIDTNESEFHRFNPLRNSDISAIEML